MDVFYNLIVEEHIISDADDDDIKYKASKVALDASYFALEEQISVAGLHNNIYSFTEISVFFFF